MQVRSRPANRQLIRDLNQNSLLNLIKTEGPVARTRLAELSGLSLATISGITGDLIERKLVLESGAAESTGGRKAGLLEIRPDGGYAIGLKLREYQLTAVILNLNAEVVYAEQLKLDMRSPTHQEAIHHLGQEIQALIERSGLSRAKMIGLGCGMPGLVDSGRGRCVDSPILGWQDVDFGEPLGQLLGMPVYIDNDVNSLAIYEKLYGQGQPYQHFMTVTVGRGVGLGLVINGDVYRGAFGGAGEFGHTVVLAGERRCECGNQGCIEAYVSDRGIVQNYLESRTRLEKQPISADGQPLDLNKVLERAREGDRAALEAFSQAGYVLGLGLANLVNMLNPELVLLSGEGAAAGDLLFGSMRETLRQHAFSRLAQQLQLLTEPTGDESWARGAGSLVLRQFFLAPI
jgi:predicted NBD/HSP70 family sugar kinase